MEKLDNEAIKILKIKLESLYDDVQDIEAQLADLPADPVVAQIRKILLAPILEDKKREYKSVMRYYKLSQGDNSDLEWEERISRAKEFPILDILAGHNIEIKRGVINCPFHSDGTASCKIYKHTNSFFCFGCQVGGDNIKLAMQLSSKSFADTVKELT